MKADSMTTDIIAKPDAIDLTEEQYRAIPALSQSNMKDLQISPLRFWHMHINPDRPKEEEEKDCFVLGSALHCKVLEPKEFDNRYAAELDPDDYPGALVTVNDYREWAQTKGVKLKGNLKSELENQLLKLDDCPPLWDMIKERHTIANQGKTILKIQELWDVENMAHVLLNEPKLAEILKEGRSEVPMFGRDKDYGVPLKCRMDWVNSDTILDLKSFVTKRGTSVEKSIADAIWYEKYYIQHYLYSTIDRQNSEPGAKPKRYVVAFIESQLPHDIRLRELKPRMHGQPTAYWQRAQIEVRACCYLYKNCFDKFGTDPWIDRQEIQAVEDEEIPQLAFS